VRVLRTLAGGRLPTLVSNGTLLLCGVLASVCMSRALGPAGRGEYITWQASAAGIAIIAIGGLPQAIVLDRTVSGRHSIDDITPALASTLSAALLAIVAMVVVLEPPVLLVVATALVVVANQASAIGAAQAQRVGRMGVEFNVARMVPQIAALAAIASLIMIGDRTTEHWLTAVAGCQAAMALAWAAWALRGTGGTDVAGLAGRTWRLFPANLANQIQYRFDLIAVAALFPHAAVAFYAVGVAAQSAVLAMGQASGMYWFSKRPGEGGLRGEVAYAVAFAGLAALPIGAVSMWWVPSVYGAAFAPAASIVAVLCVAGVVQSVDYLLVHEMLSSRSASTLFAGRLPGVVTVVVGFVLVRWLRLPLAALGLAPLAGYVASSAAFVYVMRRGRRSARPAPANVMPTLTAST
jgi:hypothetical protein